MDINLNISTISTLLENIQSNIKFKASDNKFNQITKLDNNIIKKFIEKLEKIEKIFEEDKSEKKYDNISDNKKLIERYQELFKYIKFLKTSQIKDNKFNICTLNYPDLSKSIINLYLTNILSKLVCINICFRFFNKITSYYEGWTTFSEPINSEIIFDKFLKNLFNNNGDIYYYIVNYFDNSCLKIKYDVKESTIKKNISQFEDIDITTIKTVNFKFDNLLSFNIDFDYTLYEDKEKTPSYDATRLDPKTQLKTPTSGLYYEDKVYGRCVKVENTSKKSFDSEMLGINKPSTFQIKFNIKNSDGYLLNDNISFEINYYKGLFETIGYRKIHFRYQFILSINDNKYNISPYDLDNKLDKFIV
jgi:hypothetical protein